MFPMMFIGTTLIVLLQLKGGKMEKVYILTKESKKITEEGRSFLLNSLFGDKSYHVDIVEGQILNDPKALLQMIKKNRRHMILVLSAPPRLFTFSGEKLKEIEKVLSNNCGSSSWERIQPLTKN